MWEEEEVVFLKKNNVFKVGNTKVMLREDVWVHKKDRGFFILDFWNQCDIEDITIFPVAYALCRSEQEIYELFKTNIVYGGKDDICLI